MKKVAFLVLVLAAVTANAAQVYTNEADFKAAIGGTYLLEEFANYTYGAFTGDFLDIGPQNGFSGRISAEGGANSFLWSGDGNMSTNDATDYLRVDFTGADTFATGGWFFPSNIDGLYQAGPVVIDLSDSTHYEFNPPNGTTFVGFVASQKLDWIKIDCPESPANAWSTMDHYYIGVPEPASLALLALGLLIRRR